MSHQCEYLEGCPMFKYFYRSARRVYAELYCQGDFASCARRKLRLEGQPVPDNLLPQGSRLWDESTAPPDYQA
jgi:hypothetical protein